MNDFGHFSIVLAWFLALFGVFSGIWATKKASEAWYQTTVSTTILVCVSTGLAIFALGYGFLTDDYSNQYIWQFSNKEMDPMYKVAAIWGGMDGSMLLWCFMLSVSGALVAFWADSGARRLMPSVLAVCNSSNLFFLTMTVWVTDPFRAIKAPFIPPDGNGLNPLLQNPLMAIHPPMLYAGFTTFSIPFAFCIGALISNCLSNEWLRLTRRWTLVAWGFLTIGIVLGGAWAYVELGWGGYWAWDPVENASFLPWLTGSAYLHSVMVQERKNMLKQWNVWLITATYMLTVFGTFLTRSGVVQSVHAFASTDVGWVFLVYLGVIFAVTMIFCLLRRGELKSERQIESFLSREAMFLLNNLVLLSICFAIFWGVMFPVFSEALTGQKQTVGIPFFNKVNVPLFLGLIFLMGVGPLIAWRKATLSSLRKTFLMPFASAIVVGCILLWGGVEGFYPLLSYSLCWFVLVTIIGELYRGARAQRLASGAEGSAINAVSTLVRRHRNRYGGYLVHFGVLMVTVAITASMAHKTEREFTIRPGESFAIGRYRLELQDLREVTQKNYQSSVAKVSVYNNRTGKFLGVLNPEMRRYPKNQETTTEVQLMPSLREDLYLVLVGIEQDGTTSMKVFINPLQVWLWIGTIIMVLGTVIIILPRSMAVPAVARVGATENSHV